MKPSQCTVSEAATILGGSSTWVRWLITEGELIGGRYAVRERQSLIWWVDREDAEALKQRRMNQPQGSTR